jgi:hypothetical protein
LSKAASIWVGENPLLAAWPDRIRHSISIHTVMVKRT